MHCHANARLTPRGRATVFEAGMTVTAACLAARVSQASTAAGGRAGGRPATTAWSTAAPDRRPARTACRRRSHRRGVGWEVLHVAIDDATRLVYAELLADEKARTTARFCVRARR